MNSQNIIKLDEALKKLGFDLAEEVLEIVEENRVRKNLTFEEAAEGVKNFNDFLVKKCLS